MVKDKYKKLCLFCATYNLEVTYTSNHNLRTKSAVLVDGYMAMVRVIATTVRATAELLWLVCKEKKPSLFIVQDRN